MADVSVRSEEVKAQDVLPVLSRISWGAVIDDQFEMFRRAKLMFGDIPTELLRAAHDGAGVLVGRLPLTDAKGGPLCARVRPPDITWTVE